MQKYVPGGSKAGNALAEISCEILGARVRRSGLETREAMQEKQTKRSASEPESGQGVAPPSSAISLSGKLTDFLTSTDDAVR